jgi:hypothetical protein
VNMTRGVMLAGATWLPSHELGLTGEIYAIPGDAVTGRVSLSHAVRRYIRWPSDHAPYSARANLSPAATRISSAAKAASGS